MTYDITISFKKRERTLYWCFENLQWFIKKENIIFCNLHLFKCSYLYFFLHIFIIRNIQRRVFKTKTKTPRGYLNAKGKILLCIEHCHLYHATTLYKKCNLYLTNFFSWSSINQTLYCLWVILNRKNYESIFAILLRTKRRYFKTIRNNPK